MAPASTEFVPVSDEPIRIALILPTAGPYAPLGDMQTKGIALGLGKTIAGRKVELIPIEEPVFAPQDAIQAVANASNAHTFIGIVSGATALAVRDTIHEMGKPLLVTNAVTREITGSRKSPYIYRASTTGYQVGINFGPWLYDNVGKSMATAAPDYASGHQLVDYAARFFQESGGTIAAQYWPPLGNADFSSVLTELGSSGADFVYSFFAGADAVRYVTQYGEFGLAESMPLTGLTLVDDLTLIEQGDSAEGIIQLGGWRLDLDTPENKAFVEDFQAQYDELPNSYANTGFTGGSILRSAIESIGGDVDDADLFAKAIGEAEFIAATGRPIVFDPETNNLISFQTVDKVERRSDGTLGMVEIAELGEAIDPGDDVAP